MSAKNSRKPVTEEKVAEEVTSSTQSTEEQVPKYGKEKLRANSMQLFGVTTSTFDGAFCGVDATEMTIDEARATINKWLGKE